MPHAPKPIAARIAETAAPVPDALASAAAQSTASQGPARAARRWRITGIVLGTLAVLVTAGAVGLGWIGERITDDSFVWYNRHRIAAVADRAARTPDATVVVALGSGGLRQATADETAMAALARGHGMQDLHFLRIVRDHGAFEDFDSLIDPLIRLRPALIVLDRALVYAERAPISGLARHAVGVADALLSGRRYAPDPVAAQYGRRCPAVDAGERAIAASPADSTPPAAVTAFAERARAMGIALVIADSVTTGDLIATGVHRAGVSGESLSSAQWWQHPTDLPWPGAGCDDAPGAVQARAAYSGWLVTRIAASLDSRSMQQASLH